MAWSELSVWDKIVHRTLDVSVLMGPYHLVRNGVGSRFVGGRNSLPMVIPSIVITSDLIKNLTVVPPQAEEDQREKL